MMSIARLSAGQGYRYLLRHTACGDCARDPSMPLTSYYAASGYPPGRWIGSGLAGLDGGRGLAARSTVSEEAMGRLFGSGQDPASGDPLGRPYPVYRSADERIQAAVVRLPNNLDEDERAAAIEAIERRDRARPVRAAVAGFDLTFTVPKSASVLWAIGDDATRQAITDAHHDAVGAVLRLFEQRFLHTRVGKRSCAQVDTRGMVAAAFVHFDTRSGDPNLHTHVVVANRVQGPDGKWRSLDSRALHHAAVALSEVYDVTVADLITERLGVRWAHRSRGERRSPAFEIEGVSDDLVAGFSGRSQQIETHLRELFAEFEARNDREPSRREVVRLRQQATLSTRQEKTVRPLAESIREWRQRAVALTGREPKQIVGDAVDRNRDATPPHPRAIDEVGPDVVSAFAKATIAGAAERRSTWTRPNLLAEAARATREVRVSTPGERLVLLDRVVDAALASCVALDPPAMFSTPTRFRRQDGTSAFARPDEYAYTTEAVLAAEARLLDALTIGDAPRVEHTEVAAAVERGTDPTAALRSRLRGEALTPDQQHAVEAIATRGRVVDVLVGPAGTGKTRTLRALRAVWERTHGAGSVVGLAPSATAAAELGASLGIACENTAKWLHEAGRPDPAGRWTLRSGQLVIVDEASMVSTSALDALVTQARGAGAKVALVGDHQQLGAVQAGGAFGLLAETEHALTLTALWRFRHRWEANATRGLRIGNPAALDAYTAHNRLHDGPAETMTERAYAAWSRDLAAGRSAVLVAADRTTVGVLNTRAREDRIDAGLVRPDAVPIAAGGTCGRGDVVVTRRNDRRLPTDDGGHVRNGARWCVVAVGSDGSIEVSPVPPSGTTTPPGRVTLPPDYVRDHVELGYATTVHRAQGMTVDSAHVLVAPGMTRQALYVAMTRGREANHAYVSTDGLDHTCPNPPDAHPIPTGRQILEAVLGTNGAELSATATLRARQNEATSSGRLLPIRDTLDAACTPPRFDPECADAAMEIGALLRLRAAALRDADPASSAAGARPELPITEWPTQEGMYR
jgi:conjugative relaxase-like TrwC/TraI family protein